MNKNADKVVLILSVATTMFLLFIYLNYAYFKSDFVLIGVFQELLTIPCMLALPVLLFFALRSLYMGPKGNRSYPIVSSLLVGLAIILSWGSLLFS